MKRLAFATALFLAVCSPGAQETVAVRCLEKTMTAGFPVFRKVGAVSGYAESSPFVFGGKLMRLGIMDPTHGWDLADPHVRFEVIEAETGKFVSSFGNGCYYPSVYQEGDTVYVTATQVTPGQHGPGNTISGKVMLFESKDLVRWTSRTLLERPGWRIFNTSMAKGPDGYVIALESDNPQHAGTPFTVFFATSKDMRNWTFESTDRAFPKSVYAGGPFLTYRKGHYYLFLVTALPFQRYCTYLHRTKDFKTWEIGRYNPFMTLSDEDRRIAPHAYALTDEMRAKIPTGFACSLSDVELCEWKGRTYVVYGIGDQQGFAYSCEAWYDGPMDVLLENFFK